MRDISRNKYEKTQEGHNHRDCMNEAKRKMKDQGKGKVCQWLERCIDKCYNRHLQNLHDRNMDA